MPQNSSPILGSRFVIRSLLGEGGFGQVFLAFDREIKEPCALKVIRSELVANSHYLEAFRMEALTWLHFGRHENIVSAKAVDVFNGRLFIALEFIPPDESGINTLDKMLARKRISPDQALRWAIEICWGMSYAYSCGLIAHRDLKPANLLIDQHGQIKISDFGLASHLRTESRGNGVVSGTPLYMPPEQFISSSLCNECSDIYSFGIILFQLATGGRLPFDFSARPQGDMIAFFRQLHNTFEVPTISSPINEVIHRCLLKHPEGRFNSFAQIEAELQRLLVNIAGRRYIRPSQEVVNAAECNNRAVSFYLLGQKDDALRSVELAIKAMPSFALAKNNKAAFLADIGRLTDAIQIWRTLIRDNPDLGRPFYNLANISLSKGDLAQAAQFYKQAMANEPDYTPAIVNAAICEQRRGNLSDALRLYENAAQVAPNDAQVFYNIGVFHLENERFQEAITPLSRTVALNPRHVSAHNYLGLCHASLGQKAEALKFYDAALAIDPNYQHALANKARLAQNRSGSFWGRVFGQGS
jgi:serine/threonine protein kinase